MSCRRAHEIDLLEFLDAPRRADFAGFCDHYPRCADCSAEVRAWAELRGQLASHAPATSFPAPPHPGAELLERFERAPAELAPVSRRELEVHLGSCASCREELRALRQFTPDRLAATAPPPAASGSGGKRRIWSRLLEIAWHPAFAYALVGVLLFPLLYRVVRDQRPTRAPVPDASKLASEPASPLVPGSPPALEPQGRAEAPRRELAKRSPAALEDRAGPSEEWVGAEAEGLSEPMAGRGEALAPEASPAQPRFQGTRTRELQGAMAELHERDIYIPTLRLQRGGTSRAPASELREGALLEVPLPRDHPGGWAQARVVEESPPTRADAKQSQPDTPRAFDETRAVEPRQRALVLHIPKEWLGPGRYRIDLELRDQAGKELLGRGRYRLEVEAQ